MSFVEDKKEDENIISLRLMTGGKQPPKQGKNWLSELKSWTIFLAKNPKLSKTDLFAFQVREKYSNSTCLIVMFPKEEPQVRYFSTWDFSEDYILMDIIDEPEPDNRTDLDRRLEVDVNTEEVDSVVREAGPETLLEDIRHGETDIQSDKE